MKLLLFGSLFVVLGVVALAAVEWKAMSAALDAQPESRPPIVRLVSAGGAPAGAADSAAIVWQTSTAPHDCAELIARRKRSESRRIADLLGSVADDPESLREADVCALFQGGKLANGTQVEVLDDCGSMAKVRILSGPLRGHQGCVDLGRLSDGRG